MNLDWVNVDALPGADAVPVGRLALWGLASAGHDPVRAPAASVYSV